MSKRDINLNDFIKYVHAKFEGDLDIDGVREILHLEEDYNKDSPTSLGKSLVLNRLIFSGQKNDKTEFNYDQRFYLGINIWIADNFKGKSTIFKIIKFALTGHESYKPDIKNWLSEIILEFQIGKAIYTIHIDKTGISRGALYSFGIDKFQQLRDNQQLETIEKDKEFEFKSKSNLEEHMQEFFFDHFTYYSLKYTQKSSVKEDHSLKTANLSWKSYFKSIYLESSNYEYLFFDDEGKGSQGRKIFEMILGLPLTYPINMLTVRKDRTSEEIGRLKLTDETKQRTKKSEKEEIEKRYAIVTKDLQELKESGKIRFDDKPLIEEYNQIQERVNESRKKGRAVNEAYQTENNKIDPLESEIRNLESDEEKIKTEINRLTKQELNVELYQEAGSFFSNLDIKVCPHCEVEVAENRKEKERQNHECSLCGETSTQQRVEEAELQTKLAKVKEEREGHQKKLGQLRNTIEKQRKKAQDLRASVTSLYNKVVAVPSSEADAKRLKEIEAQIEEINKERKSQQKLIEKEKELIQEEAVLKFRLDEINKEKQSDSSEEIVKLNLRNAVLSYALEALQQKRSKLNRDVISKLETLILNEIHAFGLHSINGIKINEKYDLEFTQNEVVERFGDLAEGEKLRVKLAFYLSLIQLDIEHQLGRHPRFLIFDSPGSEEMIEEHLHGLSDILKSVNERFEEELQIFVGSALREFSQITSAEKAVIKEKGEFIF